MSLKSLLILIFFFAACAREPVTVDIPPPFTPEGPDAETAQRIDQILEKVKSLAERVSLDSLGRSTMNETVFLMDIGREAVPRIIRELKLAENYKYRFWLVDILGYMNTPKSITPLVEVVENSTEREKIRLRACFSLRQLGYPAAVDYLLVSLDIAENIRVKKEIEETIKFLR